MKKEKWEKGKEKERNSPTSERREADTTLTPRRTYLLAAHVAAAHRLAHVKDPGKFTVQPALGRPPDSRTGLPRGKKSGKKRGGKGRYLRYVLFLPHHRPGAARAPAPRSPAGLSSPMSTKRAQLPGASLGDHTPTTRSGLCRSCQRPARWSACGSGNSTGARPARPARTLLRSSVPFLRARSASPEVGKMRAKSSKVSTITSKAQ